MTNQDNFKNLINPEVTRKDYSIMNRKGSSAKNNDFYIGNSQNQKILQRKEDMLHTITDNFLEASYPMAPKDPNARNAPVKAKRIHIDPQDFRDKL